MFQQYVCRPVYVLAMLAVFSGLASAQAPAVTGRVLDSQGGSVSNALVTLTTSAPTSTRNTRTLGDGSFSLTGVPDGTYQIQVDSPGFQRWTQSVTIGSTRSAVDVTLQVAAVSEGITVSGHSELDAEAPSGSRLALTERETPATVTSVSQEEMQQRGQRTALEVYNAIPGVTADYVVGDLLISMRGFTGDTINTLYDGLRIASATMVTRDVDTFNFSSVDVLKGPSSVLYGEGALAGSINMVPKQASLSPLSGEAIVATGNLNKARFAGGVNVPLGRKVAVRADASVNNSDGYVDDTDFKMLDVTASVLARPTPRLTLRGSYDHYEDEGQRYYTGAPLVPRSLAADPGDVVSTANDRVIDLAQMDTNYNARDAGMEQNSDWGRASLEYRLGTNWTFANGFNYFTAFRSWYNVNNAVYNPATQRLTRGVSLTDHDHQFWANRTTMAHEGTLGGRRNRFVAGFEFNRNNFSRPRALGNLPEVDLVAPDRGFLFEGAGPTITSRTTDYTTVDDSAFFVENAFSATSRLEIVGGLRTEYLSVDRRLDNSLTGATSSFDNSFTPTSGRIGAVYSVVPSTQLFGQYSSAVVPLATTLTLSQTNAALDLTTGDSIEIGVKSSLWSNRATFTASGYWIQQDNILTVDPNDINNSIQGGEQSSRGVEVAASVIPLPRLRVDGSLAFVDAQFDVLLEAGGIDRAGNRPPNVPAKMAAISAFYELEPVPVTLGFTLRGAGDVFLNTANNVRLQGYTTADLSAGYRFRQSTITARVRNLNDAVYADWGRTNGASLFIRPPRSFDISLTTRF